MIFISDGDLERIRTARDIASGDVDYVDSVTIHNLLNDVLDNISQLQREKPHPEPLVVIASVDPITGVDTYREKKG